MVVMVLAVTAGVTMRRLAMPQHPKMMVIHRPLTPQVRRLENILAPQQAPLRAIGAYLEILNIRNLLGSLTTSASQTPSCLVYYEDGASCRRRA